MSKQPGSDPKTILWHKRAILVDQRTPAEVAAEDGWEKPWRGPVGEEKRKKLARVNPYIERIREFPGVVVPMDEAEAYAGRWQDLYDTPRPLVVELGCGAGHFLKGCAELYPDYNYLGVELRFKRLFQAARKTAATHHSVRYVRYHVMDLKRIFAAKEISSVWIQFPDPWPKAHQASRRMVNPELVRALDSMMLSGGTVRLKSDWPYYLPWFRASFEGSAFQETEFVADLQQWDLPWQNVQTGFEERFMMEGKPCFFLEFTKK